MKTTSKLTLTLTLALFATSCANFSSVQTDVSHEKGLPSRTITTKTSSSTFFSSKSDLTRYKATTSDKIQSLGIGTLGQESPTNNILIFGNALELMKLLGTGGAGGLVH